MSAPIDPDRVAVPNEDHDVRATKLPYVKPAFRHEQVFETMALACGKINDTQLSCRTNKKSS